MKKFFDLHYNRSTKTSTLSNTLYSHALYKYVDIKIMEYIDYEINRFIREANFSESECANLNQYIKFVEHSINCFTTNKIRGRIQTGDITNEYIINMVKS